MRAQVEDLACILRASCDPDAAPGMAGKMWPISTRSQGRLGVQPEASDSRQAISASASVLASLLRDRCAHTTEDGMGHGPHLPVPCLLVRVQSGELSVTALTSGNVDPSAFRGVNVGNGSGAEPASLAETMAARLAPWASGDTLAEVLAKETLGEFELWSLGRGCAWAAQL